jgi:hypothetical protein
MLILTTVKSSYAADSGTAGFYKRDHVNPSSIHQCKDDVEGGEDVAVETGSARRAIRN